VVRLFNASSTIKKFQLGEFVYRDVPFIWYVERDAPPAPPEELILFYPDMPARQKRHSLRYMSECFTDAELQAFRAWLWETHRAELETTEVFLPLAEIQSDITIPYSELPTGGLRGHVPLYKRDDYDLPFGVVGYFDAEKVLRYVALDDEMRSRSVLYLQMALKSLGLAKGVTGQRLTSVVEALYDGLGLAVTDCEAQAKKKEPPKGRGKEPSKKT